MESNAATGSDEGQRLFEQMNIITEHYYGKGNLMKPLASRLANRIVSTLCNYCQIDLYQYRSRKVEAQDAVDHDDHHNPDKIISTRDGGILKKFSHYLYVGLLLWSAYRMLLSAGYQFVYDNHLYRYRRLNRNFDYMQPAESATTIATREGQQLSNNDNMTSKLNELQLLIEDDIKNLKLVGAPHMQLSYMAEAIYIWLIIMLSTYFQSSFYMHFIHPIDSSLFRMMINEEDEQININRLISNQVDVLIQSSSNYMRKKVCLVTQSRPIIRFLRDGNHYDKSSSLHHPIYHDIGNSVGMDGEISSESMAKLYQDHFFMVKMLKEMALNGRLQPKNRLADWMNRMASRIQTTSSIYLTYVTGYISTLVAILPNVSHAGSRGDILSLNDLTVLLASGILASVVAISSGLCMFLLSYSTVDQVYILTELIKTIDECLILNKLRFHWLTLQTNVSNQAHSRQSRANTNQVDVARLVGRMMMDGAAGNQSVQTDGPMSRIVADLESTRGDTRYSSDDIRNLMNADLLYVITHYKILLSQLKPTQGQHGFLACIVFQYILYTPPACRMVTPYIMEGSGLVALMMTVCILFLIWCDFCFLPLCYLHSRAHDLYRSLASLQAHAVELENNSNLGRGIYHRQTLELLHRELCHPHHLVNQFVARGFEIKFNYTSLIKIHFWYGLILISIYYAPNTHNNQESWTQSFSLL